MNILVVENYSFCTQHLMEGLNEATACRVYHSSSLVEALRRFEEIRPDLIVLNLEQSHLNALSAVRKIRMAANEIPVRCPAVIVVGNSFLNVAEAASCRDLEATFLLREAQELIYFETRIALWSRKIKKYERTIRFERHSGTWSMYLQLGMSWRQILVPTQPMRLALLLAGGREAYTVEEIADELGICRQSVKKYIFVLNRAVNPAQSELIETGERIFWMVRSAGGTICGLRSNVVWI